MDALLALAADPAAWIALVTLIIMEVVLGIDNLIFIAILTNRLPEHQRERARIARRGSPQEEWRVAFLVNRVSAAHHPLHFGVLLRRATMLSPSTEAENAMAA